MRIYSILFTFLFLGSCMAQSAVNESPGDTNQGIFVWVRSESGWNLDKFRQNLPVRIENANHLTINRAFLTNEDPLNRIFIISNLKDIEVERFKRIIRSWEEVQLAEDVPLFSVDHTPNDLSSRQWNLKKVQAELAWNLGKGGGNILVALIDDGLDTTHSDIQPLVWHNTKEKPGNKVDDDINGYVDDIVGWDVADNDNDPHVLISDGLNHGTHCAGIIGTVTNNNYGLAGLGYDYKIMAIKTGRKGAKGLYRPYEGVEYAVKNGARVISMSWGGGPYSATYQAIFDYAFKKNVVCVASAGNRGSSATQYPAGYDHVFSVGSTDSFDVKSIFSSYGSTVDVMAPGSDIYSTLPGNQFGYMSGTSMACPLVSGLAALMLAKNPYQTNLEVEACISQGCENINSKNTAYIGQIGAGRINAFNSMKCIKMVRAKFTSSKVFVCTGDTVQFTDQTYLAPNSWRWQFQGGTPSNSTLQNPVVRYNTSGSYMVQLIASDGVNYDTIKMLAYITVGKPTAKLTGKQTILKGDFGTVRVDFTGAPPWDLVYSNGSQTFTQTNITSNPHFILVPGDSSRVYKPISVTSSGCKGSVSDSAKITIYQKYSFLCDSVYRFQQRFGGSDDDQVYRTVEYDDTTIIIAGKTRSYGPGHFTAFVAKISVYGKLIWFKSYGGSAEESFYSLSLDERRDIYVSGYTHSNVSTKAMFVMKLNKDGSQRWKKHFDGTSLEYLRHSIYSRDKEHLYFAGPSISGSFGAEDFTVIKLDTLGNVIWSKQIGNSAFNRNEWIWEDTSGNLYTIGSQGVPHPALDGSLVKLDKNGGVIWAKCYGSTSSSYSETFAGGVPWQNKALFLYGYCGTSTTNELWLARVSMSGVLSWAKRYSIGTTNPGSIVMENDELYISGVTNNGGGDGFIVKLDTNGNILQSQALGSSSSQAIHDMINSRDGGFYYAGYDGSTGNNQFWIGKANCALSSLCNNKSLTVTVNSHSTNTTNLTFSSQNFSTATTANVSISSHTPTMGFICKNIPPDSATKTECDLDADMQIISNCTGSPVVFKDVSVDNAGYTITQWFWDFGDGYKASGSKSVNHTYKSNGSYKVELIVKSEKGTFYCLDTIVRDYVSRDSFRIHKMLPDTTICFRDSMRFGRPLTSCGEPPYFYFWSPSDGVSDILSENPYFSPLKTTTYTLNMVDFRGRTATDSFTVNVNPQCCISHARFEVKDGYSCDKDSVRLINTSTHKKNAIFNWSFQGANISSYKGVQPPPLFFQGVGAYLVTLTLSDSCSDDTFETYVSINPLPLIEVVDDTALCMPDTIVLGGSAYSWLWYEWSPATGLSNYQVASPTAKVTKPITYKLKVTSEDGCLSTDSVHISEIASERYLGNDSVICEGDSIVLSASVKGSGYLWSNGQTTPEIVVYESGIYWMRLKVKDCIFYDTVKIVVDSVPRFELPGDSVICETDFPLLIHAKNAKVPGALNAWENGYSQLQRQVSQPGVYWLERTNNYCVFRDSIVINADTKPEVNLGNDTAFCESGSGLVLIPSVSPGGVNYLWDDGSTSATRTIVNSGFFWLMITSGKCTDSDSILVRIDSIPSFDLISDTLLCLNQFPFRLAPTNVRVHNVKYLWENLSTTEERWLQEPGVYRLHATSGLCSYSDSVSVDTLQKPWVKLPPDTVICMGDTIAASAPILPKTVYSWNTGIKEPNLHIIGPGKYQVELKNKCGVAKDEIEVEIKDCSCPIHVPNSFSPGRSPNVNDYFEVVLDCPVDDFEILIYNRWGNEIFRSHDPNFKWDGMVKGSRIMNGTYYCIIKIKSRHENGGREFMRTGYLLVSE